MAYENLCMYCFEDLNGRDVCPHCGKDAHAAVPQIQMLPGTRVYRDRFLIGRAVRQDATGIVYAAFDTKRENKLRIREYLPRDCAERLNNGGVVPIAGKEDEYDAGIKKLKASVKEGEETGKRHFFFEENGTAYVVQRKTAQALPAEDRPRREEAEDRGRGKGPIIAIVAAIAVVAAALVLVFVFNGNLLSTKDVTETPTLDPNNVWLPADSVSPTPTVTPYTSPTFAALVDPELSWMDFSFEDVSVPTPPVKTNSSTQATRVPQTTARIVTATPVNRTTARPTAVPTLSGDASAYTTITSKSSQADIRKLQQRLSRLGWLNYTDVTGRFDSKTQEAVRQFQRYINQNYSPSAPLTVDGLAGPKTQQWLYQVNAVKPTATPKATAAPRDDIAVDENSGASRIRAMQRELILLGVMPEGTDTGRYDATTRSAVRRFQNRVNQIQGEDVLEATGSMDELSMAFLDYYVDLWREMTTATPTPTPRATATPRPTPTATPAPTATQYESEKDSSTIKAGSPRQAVQDVQRLLISVGMLPEGSADGVYGASTRQSVTRFQQWVNAQRGEETLSVTGEADPLTRSYLRYCRENGLRPNAATATPTVTPTQTATSTPEATLAAEDEVIQRGSDREAVRQVQELLADVGLMSRRGIDGIYGAGTNNAVKAFQEYVNAHGGELEVTGLADAATRLSLQYYSDNHMTVNDVEETATPEPTQAPTPVVTDATTPTQEVTEAPTEAPYIVDESASAEEITYIQRMLSDLGAMASAGITGEYDAVTTQAVSDFQKWVNEQGFGQLSVTGTVDADTRAMLEACLDRDLSMREVAPVENLGIKIGKSDAGDDIIEVTDARFTVSWSAEGDVESYDFHVYDSEGNDVYSGEGTRQTEFQVNINNLRPGEVYTVRVGARPMGGSDEDVLWQNATFTRPVEATPEPLPTALPIKAPEITIDGAADEDDVVEIKSDTFSLHWESEGDVDSYNVQIVDGSGNVMLNQLGIHNTEGTLKASALTPGEIYTITVGATPINGTDEDMLISRARFTLPIVITPEPTAIPTPTPTPAPTPEPTVAEVSRPFVNIGGAGYQQNGLQIMTDDTLILSWGAEGAVAGYVVYMENEAGDRSDLGYTDDTSRTISSANLPAGIYTLYVGAIPAGGDEEDAQWGTARFAIAGEEPSAERKADDTRQDEQVEEPREDSEPVEGEREDEVPVSEPETPSFIAADSDPQLISRLQQRLYALGLLAGEPEQGILDEVTLQAVADFQTRVNEQYDAGLSVIDPYDPNVVIDAETLRWIAQGL